MSRHRDRAAAAAARGGRLFPRRALAFAAALALGALVSACKPAPVAFPGEPSGQLEIKYPLDETLFPPEIVAPTFVWSDQTAGVAEWRVLLKFEGEEGLLRFAATEPSWRPSEAGRRGAALASFRRA